MVEENRKIPVLECIKIRKEYPGTQALHDVDLQVNQGEILGLIGENGAGKSTLLKIIMGFEKQTSGNMRKEGKEYVPSNTLEANACGIGMVFQEQSLVSNLTVAQNIFLGREKRFKTCGTAVRWREMNREAEKILGDIGISDIQPQKLVLDYNFSVRQMVEVAKVLSTIRDSKAGRCLVLFDEPTSLLNEEEVKRLFGHIRRLNEKGHSVIFVSHRLDEVLEISDRICVFKDGKNAGSVITKDADEHLLYEMMVGRSTTGEYFRIEEQSAPGKRVLLEAEKISLRSSFKDVSLTLHEGEILGICGVVGSGKEEVCNVLCGDKRMDTGILRVKGEEVRFTTPGAAQKRGILCVPKERRIEGIVGLLPVEENIALSSLNRLKTGPFLKRKAVRSLYEKWHRQLSIKCSSPRTAVQDLSGGNAQKVVFSRVLASDADILILNHPTRGVDIGAKEEIYGLIREMSKEGKGIILLCDTLDEAIGLSHRILIMKDGLITGELEANKYHKPDKVQIVEYMM